MIYKGAFCGHSFSLLNVFNFKDLKTYKKSNQVKVYFKV